MSEKQPALLKLILCRFLLVCLIIVATRFTLPTQVLSQLLWPLFLGILVLTGLFLLSWRYSNRQTWLYELQFYSDFTLLASFICFSGGIDSLFMPLYVLIIVYASLIKGQRGGILAVTLAIVSSLGIVLLEYLGQLPGQAGPSEPQYLIYRLSVSVLAFIAVAFLGTTLSERLQRTGRKLDTALVLQENIIDSIRSGLLTLDSGGTVHYANPVGLAILGLEKDPRGLPVSSLFSLEVWAKFQAFNYGSHHRALRLETWIDKPTHGKVCIGMSCSPLLSRERKRIGYVVSFQDLTEIKEREEDYQLREKLAAVGELAAGVAHELRNPLASLSGSIQILRSELSLSEEQARLLGIVLRESERLNRIVGDFLEYARPQPFSREKTDVTILVRETIDLLRNSREFTSGRHRLDLSLDTSPLFCAGNPDQLKQVVWNIVQNGIRAMPDGGRLRVRVSRKNGRILLQVRDEGVGMNRATREKLFQPFQSGFPGGSGLGMALVYQAVQKHDGTIEVDSKVGKGTQITILLPLFSEDRQP